MERNVPNAKAISVANPNSVKIAVFNFTRNALNAISYSEQALGIAIIVERLYHNKFRNFFFLFFYSNKSIILSFKPSSAAIIFFILVFAFNFSTCEGT
jgi:hypothetical protein